MSVLETELSPKIFHVSHHSRFVFYTLLNLLQWFYFGLQQLYSQRGSQPHSLLNQYSPVPRAHSSTAGKDVP